MLVVYVKLWRIDGQRQTHIAGKSFRISQAEDIAGVLDWVEATIHSCLAREVESGERAAG